MILREFNEAGIQAFREFLAKCRETPTTPIPPQLLEDDALSAEISPSVTVSPTHLTTKADAAGYLDSVLGHLPDQDMVANSAGLWTWLSLLLFDEVCPAEDGVRSVKNDYYYVFEPRKPRHFYRHLLFISWRILRIAPKHNRLFLSSSLSSLDKVTTEVMKRLYLTRIPCIFEVLDRLYWDPARGRARSGVVTQEKVNRGDLLHRLPLRIRQLEMTYDLFSLNADQLIELLGEEFQHNPQPARPALQRA